MDLPTAREPTGVRVLLGDLKDVKSIGCHMYYVVDGKSNLNAMRHDARFYSSDDPHLLMRYSTLIHWHHKNVTCSDEYAHEFYPVEQPAGK